MIIKINQMKTVITVCCLVLAGMLSKAEGREKTYEKTFPKEGVEELVLSNTSGKMEIVQVDGSDITISAVMKVTAKSDAKADEILEKIQVNDTRMSSYVKVETVFGKDMGLKQFLGGMDIKVDYKVNVPKGIKLRLISNNGNIYLGHFTGELNADIRNGDLKAAVLNGGEVYIKQEKGIFSVEEIAWLNGDFKSTMIQIGSGGEIRLNTNSCDGELESVDKLDIRSSGGSMQIGDVEELRGSSSFTKYEVQDLANNLDMDMKMGEMNVRNIQLLFSEIRLKGSFTKVGLTFMKDAGYHLEIKRNKSLKLDLPQGVTLEEQPTSVKNVLDGKAFVGNVKYSGKVFLELSNGSLFIQ